MPFPFSKLRPFKGQFITKERSVIIWLFLSPVFAIHVLTIESFRNSFVEYDISFLVVYISCLIFLWTYTSLPAKTKLDHTINLQFSLIRIALTVFLVVVLIQSLFNKSIEIRLVIYLYLFYGLFEFFRYLFSKGAFKDSIICSFLAGVSIEIIFLKSNITFLRSPEMPDSVININRGVLINHLVLIIPFLMSISVYFKGKSPVLSFVAVVFTVLCSSIVMRSDIRTGWIALISTGVIFFKDYTLSCYRYLTNKSALGIRKGLIIFCVSVITIFLAIAAYNYKIASSKGHLLVLKTSVEMWLKAPVTGMGLNRFQGNYNHFQVQHLKNTKYGDALVADNTFYAFNEYLQLLIETGIVGIILPALACYVTFLAITKKHKNILYTGACAGLLAMGICCLTSYPLHSPATGVFAAFYIAIIDSSETALLATKVILRPPVKICLATLLLVILSYSILMEINRFKALDKWSTAANYALDNKFVQANVIYKKCYPTLKKNGSFLFNYGSELSIAGHYSESLKILLEGARFFPNYNLYIYLGQSYEQLGKVRDAENSYRYASYMIPSKYLGKYLLLHLYEKLNKKEKALALASDIIASPVKIPSSDINNYKAYAMDLKLRLSRTNQ